MKNEKKIYVDVTSTIKTLHITGIQRVVSKISKELQNLQNENIIFIKLNHKEKYIVANINWNKYSDKKNKNILAYYLKKIIPRAIKNNLNRNLMKLLKINEKIISIIKKDKIIEAKKGDTLLLMDATWNYSPWKEIRRLKREGVIISQVIYDLLPIKHPDLFINELVDQFKNWTIMISYYCDNLYCISETVKKDVIKYVIPKMGNKFNRIEIIKMGSDIQSNDEEIIKIKNLNACKNKFLSVGTIEPRKNYDFILSAFNEIWSKNGNESVTWTIVGKVGWKTENLMMELKNHPEYGRRLKIYIEANDKTLNSLYEESACVIVASVDEGYGLPILEAIGKNCIVLLSKIEVFREFKLDDSYYFSILDKEELINKINMILKMTHLFKQQEINTIKWKNSAENFYNELIKS